MLNQCQAQKTKTKKTWRKPHHGSDRQRVFSVARRSQIFEAHKRLELAFADFEDRVSHMPKNVDSL